MTQNGELFGEGPQACPFIALELDRDRRSDKPDYRHRCFAEPTPQPRAIAHQEQYCLSPDFAACPIFQGWAMRAAARPVPVPAGYEGRARPPEPVSEPIPPPMPRSATQPPLPIDVPPVVPPPGEAWPTDTFAPPQEPDAPSQLPAFEVASAAMPAASPDFVASEPPFVPSSEADVPSAWSSSSAGAQNSLSADDPPVPGFLAGRSERAPTTARARASKPDVPYREQVSREDLVPSWELTDKYGADVTDRRAASREGVGGGGADDGGDRFGGVVTAVAVIAILALGVLGVIFLPGLLAGHGATPTATPSFVAVVPTDSLLPTFTPLTTPLVTPQPTAIPPSPSPEATPRLYKVKASDNSLTQIAHRFGITLGQLLAANPQITNPDHIFVGQVIVIPYPPPSPSPTA